MNLSVGDSKHESQKTGATEASERRRPRSLSAAGKKATAIYHNQYVKHRLFIAENYFNEAESLILPKARQ
jgi:hypothetical protein